MPKANKTDYMLFTTLRQQVDLHLSRLLPPGDLPPVELHGAMRYSVLADGKRLRPILAILSYRMAGGLDDAIMTSACALELLHTFSLIHDDLPCMDDDDFRRGQPTLHRKYSEYIAVLAGDALHALAFELLAQTENGAVVAEVGRAIGTEGMIGGQVRDVQAEGQDVTVGQVEDIHRRKTGALIAASVNIGGLLAGASREWLKSMDVFGRELGLAFQIVDDILDVEGDPELLGKSVGADDRLAKATYPKVVGLEESKRMAAELIDHAKSALTGFPDNEALFQLADYILCRGD
jgi:geranylgeranyl diphosphate synthase type II